MTRTVQDYYAEFSAGYGGKIRQLVPRYDEMLEVMLDLLVLVRPGSVLDLGAGIGNVSELVLQAVPDARVTALDASPEMLAQARERLAPYGERGAIVHGDIATYQPTRAFGAVISNLTLHNLPLEPKRETLYAIGRWLEPAGAFIWGDLILHPDPAVQRQVVRQRTEHALAAGCPRDFVDWNFEKESALDHPWTAAQTLEELAAAGFERPTLAWAHDAFAIFFAAKGNAP